MRGEGKERRGEERKEKGKEITSFRVVERLKMVNAQRSSPIQ